MEEDLNIQNKTETKSKVERIQVAVRVRPFLNKEYTKEEVVYWDAKKKSIKISDLTHVVESKYDKILDQKASQQQSFNFVKDSIEDAINGINCTIFAYGQTGSGKTYTMFGPKWEESVASRLMACYNKNDFFSNTENHGLIPRSISELFNKIDTSTYSVYCSFIQIYNEKLYDLLQDPNTENPLIIREEKSSSSTNKIGNIEYPSVSMYVQGLTEYLVQNERECFVLLKRGERNR